MLMSLPWRPTRGHTVLMVWRLDLGVAYIRARISPGSDALIVRESVYRSEREEGRVEQATSLRTSNVAVAKSDLAPTTPPRIVPY